MSILITNGDVFYRNKLQKMNIYVDDLGKNTIAESIDLEVDEVIDASNCLIIPSLTSCYCINSSTIKTKSSAMVKGGFNQGFIFDEKYQTLKDFKKLKEDIKFDSNIDFMPISNEKATKDSDDFTFMYYLNTFDLNLINEVLKVNGVLVVDGKNHDLVKNIIELNSKVLVYIHGLEDIELIKQTKKFNIVLDIDLELLVAHLDEYLPLIKNKTIEFITCSSDTLEYAFAYAYTNLVKPKHLKLNELIDLMSYNICNILGVNGGELQNFELCNLNIFDTHVNDRIFKRDIIENENNHLINTNVSSKLLLNIIGGKIVYRDNI